MLKGTINTCVSKRFDYSGFLNSIAGFFTRFFFKVDFEIRIGQAGFSTKSVPD